MSDIHTDPFDTDFFQTVPVEPVTGSERVAGGAGMWILHLVKISMLLYTGYHGVSAALHYASTPVAKAMQIAGFLSVEAVLLGLYLAYLNKMLLSQKQRVFALGLYMTLLAIVVAAVVIDSQIAAYGVASLSGNVALYFNWILPVSPLVAGVGAGIVHILDDNNIAEQQQQQQRLQSEREARALRFNSSQQIDATRLAAAQVVANAQLASRMFVSQALANQVRSPEVLAALQQAALQNVPSVLANAGIPYSPGNVIELPAPAPAMQEEPTAAARFRPAPFRLDDSDRATRGQAEQPAVTAVESAPPARRVTIRPRPVRRDDGGTTR